MHRFPELLEIWLFPSSSLMKVSLGFTAISIGWSASSHEGN